MPVAACMSARSLSDLMAERISEGNGVASLGELRERKDGLVGGSRSGIDRRETHGRSRVLEEPLASMDGPAGRCHDNIFVEGALWGP